MAIVPAMVKAGLIIGGEVRRGADPASGEGAVVRPQLLQPGRQRVPGPADQGPERYPSWWYNEDGVRAF